jgi:hypothetical protein
MDSSTAGVLCTVNQAEEFVLFQFPNRFAEASEPVTLRVAFVDVGRSPVLHTWIETADANGDECFRLPVNVSPELMRTWAKVAPVNAPLPSDARGMVWCLQVRMASSCSINSLFFQ